MSTETTEQRLKRLRPLIPNTVSDAALRKTASDMP